MVTTKTADLLCTMSVRLLAIADAVYVTDEDISADLSVVAASLARSAVALEDRLVKYARSAQYDQ